MAVQQSSLRFTPTGSFHTGAWSMQLRDYAALVRRLTLLLGKKEPDGHSRSGGMYIFPDGLLVSWGNPILYWNMTDLRPDTLVYFPLHGLKEMGDILSTELKPKDYVRLRVMNGNLVLSAQTGPQSATLQGIPCDTDRETGGVIVVRQGNAEYLRCRYIEKTTKEWTDTRLNTGFFCVAADQLTLAAQLLDPKCGDRGLETRVYNVGSEDIHAEEGVRSYTPTFVEFIRHDDYYAPREGVILMCCLEERCVRRYRDGVELTDIDNNLPPFAPEEREECEEDAREREFESWWAD